jgi:sugar/nucleoside kinase (ribokinase family)
MIDEAIYDVVGLGNAIVDVLAPVDDVFLNKLNIHKGTMTLVGLDQAGDIFEKMPPVSMISGGSVANTMAGLASLGGRGAFVGKVTNDQIGQFFSHDIQAAGVDFSTPIATDGPDTSKCLIMVTPDAQRSMCTYLGASTSLNVADLDQDLIESAQIVYLEGYLWDSPQPREALRQAATWAREAGRLVAFTLSDPFLMQRYREDFLEFIPSMVDVLFANEAEITALYQVNTLEEAIERVRGDVAVAAITRGADGSVVISGDDRYPVPAASVTKIIDTTGAGDLYAAGFLYGYSRNYRLDDCAILGGIAAAEIISHVGARPELTLSDLIPRDLSAA